MKALSKKQAITELKKQFSHKDLVKELDKVFSLFIRYRDDQTCVQCGKTKAAGAIIQAGHIFSRTYWPTRWNDLNVHAQCSYCNMKHSQDKYDYERWFVKRYGEVALESLRIRSRSRGRKATASELRLMIELYKKALNEKVRD